MPTPKLNPADKLLGDEQVIALFKDPPLIPARYSMALMFDEGVNQLVIPTLLGRLARLNITTAHQEGLAGEVSDFRLLAHARKKACTLVVDDSGFALVDKRLKALGLDHAGIIMVNSGSAAGVQRLVTFVMGMYEHSIEKDIPNILHNILWQA